MTSEIKSLVFQEINNNEIIKLQDLYQTVLEKIKDPSKTETQKRHRVRSVLDELRRSDRIYRIAPSTYKKMGQDWLK